MSEFEKLKNQLIDKLSKVQSSKEVDIIRTEIFGKSGLYFVGESGFYCVCVCVCVIVALNYRYAPDYLPPSASALVVRSRGLRTGDI